jgi:hypothetical protein
MAIGIRLRLNVRSVNVQHSTFQRATALALALRTSIDPLGSKIGLLASIFAQ